jgi:hypothetical protein
MIKKKLKKLNKLLKRKFCKYDTAEREKNIKMLRA